MIKLTIALLCLFSISSTVLAGQMSPFSFGGRNNFVYTPDNVRPDLPMFTILHGCTQNPTDIAAGSKMVHTHPLFFPLPCSMKLLLILDCPAFPHNGVQNQLADIYGFVVLYPEQPSSANLNKYVCPPPPTRLSPDPSCGNFFSRCWNWFDASHQSRGAGEPQLIAQMTSSVIQKFSVNPSRVFVAGISAGAAMSNIVGACYPDVFSGIGSVSGLEYKAAVDMLGAFTAMTEGGPAPQIQGGLAYRAGGSAARVQYALVTQGTADYTVFPVNGAQNYPTLCSLAFFLKKKKHLYFRSSSCFFLGLLR